MERSEDQWENLKKEFADGKALWTREEIAFLFLRIFEAEQLVSNYVEFAEKVFIQAGEACGYSVSALQGEDSHGE